MASAGVPFPGAMGPGGAMQQPRVLPRASAPARSPAPRQDQARLRDLSDF